MVKGFFRGKTGRILQVVALNIKKFFVMKSYENSKITLKSSPKLAD